MKYKNLKSFIANTLLVCMNSDGLLGFDLSHSGHWVLRGSYEGSKTVMECARTCKLDCVAINTMANICYHYQNKGDIVSSNERYVSDAKAYIKCLGSYIGWNSSFLLHLPPASLIYMYKHVIFQRLNNSIFMDYYCGI